MKLTPWIPPDVKPAHVGWYQTYTMGAAIGHSYWNGKKWSGTYFHCYVKVKIKSLNYSGAIQRKTWRSLAEKP